jgi:hypothetical protein
VKHGDLIEHDDRLWSSGWRRFRSTAFHEEECGTKLFPRCRVLVSKERLEQKWPTEKDGPEGEAFRKFAARLADAVQKALAEGKTIAAGFVPWPGEPCYCPLGCFPEAVTCQPTGAPSSWAEGKRPIDRFAIRDFYLAFEGEKGSPDSPYYRLGQVYRARFVTKGNQENV